MTNHRVKTAALYQLGLMRLDCWPSNAKRRFFLFASIARTT